MNFLRSIQTKLFISFTSFVVPIIIIFGILTYVYMSGATKNEILQNKLRTTINISSLLDSELKSMDNISNQVIFSNVINDNLNKIFNYPLTSNDELTSLRLVSNSLYSFMGPSLTIKQTIIFNDNFFISAGIKSLVPSSNMLLQIYNSDIINNTISLAGGKYILPTHSDIWTDNEDNLVSVLRLFQNANSPSSPVIVEVQQDYKTFADIIHSNTYNDYNNTFVFSDKGEIIYPFSEIKDMTSKEASYYYKLIKEKNANGTLLVKNPNAISNDFITYNRSAYSNWIVVSIVDEKSLLSSISSIKNLTVIGVFATTIVILIISFLLSKQLSKPITRIHTAIENLRLDNLTSHNLLQESAQINELEKLYIAFFDMCSRLKISVNEAIQARSRESKAQLLALQSQMNPHFLYNTLTTIAVISEEKGQNEIFTMCKQLTDMLRYISTESVEGVPVKDELAHTISYLNLMKMRYEDRLIWNIDTDETMLSVVIPKLTIQPLVENYIQHGLTQVPSPWKVSISIAKAGQTCCITVKDNGPGFDCQVLKKIKDQMEQYSKDLAEGNETVSLNIGGMGLLNIYARLMLLFKDTAYFSIKLESSAGAEITIQIPLKNREEL